ncbi:hypothetical protein BDF20DRAFT_212438 [Mycotypha africana]|uniref:uncharacterized protein n=1 Tax=Mycotypha africana TaxID=64632 RepID=UPI002301C8CC|nr:uncharacterized protein BDF20DRAFT_212438 [Mycotypha africana]KAI8967781.1 hypothetical protein BDF20DRAFT_212438 [Mycotypha africana]
MRRVWEACQQQPSPISQLVFSTFVLEGFSIAEKLNIPSLVVSLFPLELFPMPDGFEEAVQEAYPAQYQAWKGKHNLWDTHIKPWMWRLLLEDQGDFRQDVLHLPLLPDLAQAPQLVYAIDPDLWQNSPTGIPVCGCWSLHHVVDQEPSLPPAATTVSSPTLLVHFGSMDTLANVLIYPTQSDFVTHVKARLDELLTTLDHLHILWIVSSDTLRTYLEQCLPSTQERLQILKSTGSHASLLQQHPSLVGAVHHGGIGTCFTMLELGLPQAILPFKFDQFYWSDQLAALHLSETLSEHASWVPAVSRMMMMKMQQSSKARAAALDWQMKCRKNTARGLNQVIRILSQSDSH